MFQAMYTALHNALTLNVRIQFSPEQILGADVMNILQCSWGRGGGQTGLYLKLFQQS